MPSNFIGVHSTESSGDGVLEVSSSNMPYYRNKKAHLHVAALFLFFLYEKGHLKEKTQSKNEIRRLFKEFKIEFINTDPSLALTAREFPSLYNIIILFLERRLLLRMMGVETNVLRFHQHNVQIFLKIFWKKVLSQKIPDAEQNGISGKNDLKKDKSLKNKRMSQIFIDQRFAFKLIEKFGDKVSSMKPVERFTCTNCSVNFTTKNEVTIHNAEDSHQIRWRYQVKRKEMQASFHSLNMNVTNCSALEHVSVKNEPLFPNAKCESEEQMVVEVTGKDCIMGSMNITVINLSGCTIVLTNLLKVDRGFNICSIEKQNSKDSLYIAPFNLPKQMSNGASVRLHVKLSVQSIGRSDFFIFLKVFKDNQFSFIMQKICVTVDSDFTVSDTVAVPVVTTEIKKEVVPGLVLKSVKLVRTRTPKKKKNDPKGLVLKDYHIPKGLVNVLNHGFKMYKNMTNDEDVLRRKLWKMFENGLSIHNYQEYFSHLLFIEHHQMTVDILKYRLFDVPLLKTSTTQYLALDVPGLAEKRPSVLRGDSIMVTLRNESDVEYEGKVHKIENTRVILKFNAKLMSIFIPNMKVDVRFDFSRRPHNLQHQALEIMVEKGLIPFIAFPSKFNVFPAKKPAINWYNRLLATNERQKSAVINIISGNSRPAPYLLFGPPGTGKTVTVVEAILQILAMDEKAHILVTAPSNAAADVISSRLLHSMPPSQLLRIYSPCREWNQVPEILQKSCNYKASSGYFEIPDLAEIMKPRVIAVTMITAGRLVSLQMPSDHFTHIFVDECGQGLEPEALISVAGLFDCDDRTKVPTGQLVLSGDPLQLGPVLRSPIAKKLGLEMSLLERLMTSIEIYERDCDTNEYNPALLTKLVKNFRSHPAILDLPNRLFYEGELIASGDQGMTFSACNWEHLPKKGVPIVFHGIEGKEQRDEHSPSYFNISEIHQVVFYLKEILSSKFCGARLSETEIGIISPYRRQVEKIRASLSKNNIGKGVTVASVEEFQGQERRVIIISTVRSDPQKINLDRKFRLGFLREPKRFNVAVTRAKALLIIIGNPHVLQGDPCWGELLKMCVKLECYTGVPFEMVPSDSDAEEEDEDDEDEFRRANLTDEMKKSETKTAWSDRSLLDKFEKLSLKANDTSDVTKMIDPPWESHE